MTTIVLITVQTASSALAQAISRNGSIGTGARSNFLTCGCLASNRWKESCFCGARSAFDISRWLAGRADRYSKITNAILRECLKFRLSDQRGPAAPSILHCSCAMEGLPRRLAAAARCTASGVTLSVPATLKDQGRTHETSLLIGLISRGHRQS
jgi:hypothetical protein